LSANATIFALIAGTTGDIRTNMVNSLAAVRKVSVEALEAEFSVYQAENAEKLEKERKRQERETLKGVLEGLNAEAQDMDLESEDLAEFVGRVVGVGGSVTLTPELTLEVTLPTVRKGGTGGGKPGATQPRPFADSSGERILGPVTTWLDANYTAQLQADMGVFRPNGKRRAGQNLVDVLIKAGALIPLAL